MDAFSSFLTPDTHSTHHRSSSRHRASSHRSHSHTRSRSSSRERKQRGAFVRHKSDSAHHHHGASSTSGGHQHHSSSRHRHSSDEREGHRPSLSRSASSFFRLANPSTHSVRSAHSSSSSYYKRRPRTGYVNALVRKFKHLLRELWYYARRHPIKIFLFVIMPLISGGVLAGFAKQFGIRLPSFLMGKAAASHMGGGYYGSHGYGGQSGGMGALGGLTSVVAGGGAMDGIFKLAKNFL